MLRRLRDEDAAKVLALNLANVEALAPMDEDRLGELEKLADRFDVVDTEGELAGFVITFGPQAAYDSENYQWFAERFGDRFYYLDRIVLDDRFRRRGLATFVYDEVEAVAAAYGRLALEVNLLPRNDISLSFHERRGFREVGRLGDGEKLVSMMEKRL
ncbi:MAG: GNAT family N-acetyltransferase [Actinomycetota bacterium]|nr:GNAT family N-acetyltransferase [Actinomycetota bacterium]